MNYQRYGGCLGVVNYTCLLGVEEGAVCPWTTWLRIRVLRIAFWLYTPGFVFCEAASFAARCFGPLLQFSVRLTGVGWIHLRVLSLALLLRGLAFIGSTTTLTACRIWLLLLLERSCLNASDVVTRCGLCLWLRLSPSTWTWISPIKILRHELKKRG